MPINAQDYLSPDSGEFAGHRILNAETGWPEVKRGLGLIFLGHVAAFLLAMAVLFLAQFMDAIADHLQSGTGKGQAQWGTAAFILSIFIIGILFCIFNIMIILGQWKCLWAPERHWAKQFAFACLTCFVMAEMLYWVSYFMGGNFSLAYLVLGGISFILFTLFLRAVAACFDNAFRVWLVNLFILLIIALVGGSVYMQYRPESLWRILDDFKTVKEGGFASLKTDTKILLALNLGWGLAGLWYVGLVWSARGAVARGLRNRRSPLDPNQ